MPDSNQTLDSSAVIINLARALTGRLELTEIPPARWPEISQVAGLHKLAPLLLWVADQAGFSIPDIDALLLLQGTAQIADFKFQLLRESQSGLETALVQAGIPTIWLKGIALAQTVYPQPHLRLMDDLDLLVPYEQREAALAVAQTIGYRPAPKDPLSEKIGEPEIPDHHYVLIGGPSNRIPIEIHFRLVGAERLLPIKEIDWFWQESETVGQGEAAFRLLKPEAHFLYLCAHAILQHGEAEFLLLRFYDLHLMALQPGFNWDIVINRAVELGWTYAVERALTLTNEYFDTPIPSRVFSELKGRRPQREDVSRAIRLQGPGHRWEGTLLSMEGVPFPERLRQLFWLVFPPPGYMRSRYSIPPGRMLLPYYFFRWSDAGGQVFQALLRRYH